jgi:ribonuclease BN (tRNA processing enzyme)
VRAAALALLAALAAPPAHAEGCGAGGVQLQVLGAGAGPGARGAASSYLVWLDGKPRVLIDAGHGAALRFAEAGAAVAELDVVLLGNLHAAHSADLPALVQAGLGEGRQRPLPLYGPTGNKLMPHSVDFVRALFDSQRGAYRYLGEVLSPLARKTFRLEPHDMREKPRKLGMPRRPEDELLTAFANERVRATAAYVASEPWPVLAWRVEAAGKDIVVDGDGESDGARLAQLAHGADLLVARRPRVEGAAAALGRLAHTAQVKQLVLAGAAPGRDDDPLARLRQHYAGTVAPAADLDCFSP